MAAVKKSVSVKDVARLAGVSEQTVSRTVHDSPSVRPETKERVRAAMRELGYRPNFAGRSLRRGKFKTVGVAMFNITGTGNLDRMEGFAAAADKHGYAITLTKVDGHPYTLESASTRMSALPVDGMVVIMNRMPADFGTFEPLPGMAMVPLVGSIACGTPITAEQNIEQYIGVPAAWHADFALTCHGDSMAPTICDGDIVCIRCQPEVEQGEIAAVRIGEEVTLKHVYLHDNFIELRPENPAFESIILTKEEMNTVVIEGKAVGLCRDI